MQRVAFSAGNAFSRWEFTPFALLVLLAVVAAAVWYLRAQWSVSLRGRRWRPARTLSFLAGLVAIDLALQSPVATFTMSYFQAHVVQHLLLMVIGPPLLAMGAPMTLALQTSSRTTKVALLKGLNSRPFRWITHPLPVWTLYYFSMFAFFLTVALQDAMTHMWAMDLVNVAFLFSATLFWWPIIGVDPIPHWQLSHGLKMASLLIGVPLESFLALIPVFLQWIRVEERKTARLDARLDAEMAAAGMPAHRPEPPSDHAAGGVAPGLPLAEG